jgi:hypothetical protein
MILKYAAAAVVLGLTLGACLVAARERRGRPVAPWHFLLVPLLLLVPTLVLLYLPPPEFGDPEVWMLALVAGVAGVARGALVGLQVDHAKRRILVWRAPDAFWIAVVALLLIVLDVAAAPVGQLSSAFVGTIELALVVLTGIIVGRNAAILVRSRDAPQHDLD